MIVGDLIWMGSDFIHLEVYLCEAALTKGLKTMTCDLS